MPEPFRQTLISSRANVNAETALIRGEDVVPGFGMPWSLRKFRLRGGRQEGVDLIELNNGAMTLRVIPTRGLNIFDVRMGDVRLGWDSPVDEIVHPSLVQPHNRGGLGFLEAFNEWLCRCGLEWFGAPGEDSHHEAAAEVPASNLTLHGKLANTPASEVELIAETEPPYRIWLWGVVRERMLFGPKLELRTGISLVPGEGRFRVEDHVCNAGGQAEEFGLLYHVNYGPPLLEDGAELIAPAARVTPASERATEGGVAAYGKFGPPETGYAEKVYLMTLHGDEAGQTGVMLRNRGGDKAVTMGWSTAELPCFTLWKSTQAEADGYVTGLEPCTHYPGPRPAEREAGRVPKLASGGTYRASIDFEIHRGAEAVGKAAERIEQIRGGREAQIDDQPPG